MHNYKIVIEYDGTNFVGWQQQENGQSIQSALQEALVKLSNEKVIIFGAGRTDAGVHAYGQVASFNLNKKIIQFASENNKKKIGKYTPGSHIKIISDKDFNKKRIDYAILLSWNYKKFFLSKAQFIKEGGKFIIPFPSAHIK